MSNYLSKVVYLREDQYASLVSNTNTTIGGHKFDPYALYITDTAGNASTVNNHSVSANVPSNALFTDYYHSTGSWSGLTYTFVGVNGASDLSITIPNKIQTDWELNAASGSSPYLKFTRDSNLTDWAISVTAGKLVFWSCTNASSWQERASFADNSGNFSVTGTMQASGYIGLPEASTTTKGITLVGAANGAAAFSHTHYYLPTSDTGSKTQPIYFSSSAVALCEQMFPIYSTSYVAASTTLPGAYSTLVGSGGAPNPATGDSTGWWGSVMVSPGVNSSSALYQTQLYIGSQSTSAAYTHAYMRRLASDGWSPWSTILDNRNTYATTSSAISLPWNTSTTIATINSVAIKIKLPSEPTLSSLGGAASSHTHGNISNTGTLGSASYAVVTDSDKKITVADLSVSANAAASTSGTTFVSSVTSDSQGKIYVSRNLVPTGYGSIKVSKQSTGTSAFAGNTAAITSTTSVTANEVLNITSKNKWIVIKGVNSTDGADDIQFGHYVPASISNGSTSAQTPGYGSTFNIPTITLDAAGHVTEVGTTTVKIPASDNTKGALKICSTTSTTNAVSAITTDPYVNLVEGTGTTPQSYTQFSGDGATTVQSDAAAKKITISSTDENVSQIGSTGNKEYCALFKATGNNTDSVTGHTAFANGSGKLITGNFSSGRFSAVSFRVQEAVTLQWNLTDSALEFVFA